MLLLVELLQFHLWTSTQNLSVIMPHINYIQHVAMTDLKHSNYLIIQSYLSQCNG